MSRSLYNSAAGGIFVDSQRPKLVVLLWTVRDRAKFLFCGLSEAAGGGFYGLTGAMEKTSQGIKALQMISSLVSISTAPRGRRLGMHHRKGLAVDPKVSAIVCSSGGKSEIMKSMKGSPHHWSTR